MRKTFIFIGLFLSFGFASHALAQGFVPLAPIPGLTDTSATSVINSATLASFFNNLYKYLIGLAATLAVIQIIWAGIEIALNRDNASKLLDEKGKIYNAIFGLILVLSPALIFSIINPSILNLSLDLPPIKPLVGGAGNTSSTVATPATGCTMTPNSGEYLETAVCASQDAANAYSCTNGLNLQVPPCKTTDPNGVCKDTSVTVYCSGKNINTVHYTPYTTHLGIVTITGTQGVLPSDVSTEQSFTTSCTNNGGVVKGLITTASQVFLRSQVFHLYSGCPSDSGITFDTAKYDGVVCFNTVQSCNPPGQ